MYLMCMDENIFSMNILQQHIILNLNNTTVCNDKVGTGLDHGCLSNELTALFSVSVTK